MRSDIKRVYEIMHENTLYMELWNVLFPDDESLHILTIYDWETAKREAERLKPIVEGKKVVEIGAGVGLLAACMAEHASLVVAVELDPAWARIYLKHIYPTVLAKRLPLLYFAGDARHLEALGKVFDVAVIYTYSTEEQLKQLAEKIARKVIIQHPIKPYLEKLAEQLEMLADGGG